MSTRFIYQKISRYPSSTQNYILHEKQYFSVQFPSINPLQNMTQNKRTLRSSKKLNQQQQDLQFEQAVKLRQSGPLNKYAYKRQPSPPIQSESQSQHPQDFSYNQPSQEQPKKGKRKSQSKKQIKKKKIGEEQQNEGIRIIEEKRIETLFRNICDMDGCITLDSLGKSLIKHKIDFKLKDLKVHSQKIQEMFRLVKPIETQEQSESEQPRNHQSQLEQWMREIRITQKQFRAFHNKIMKKQG